MSQTTYLVSRQLARLARSDERMRRGKDAGDDVSGLVLAAENNTAECAEDSRRTSGSRGGGESGPASFRADLECVMLLVCVHGAARSRRRPFGKRSAVEASELS
jgi:hypothetical protein